ncbi:MAG: MFS transporter [Candidatus Altiarchaeota archaeon]
MYRGRGFISIYLNQILYMFPAIFAWGFIYFYFIKEGFSVQDILLFRLASWVSAALIVLIVRRFFTMRYMAAGFFAFALEMMAVPYLENSAQLILLGVFDGLTSPLYWVPYNILYFRIRKGAKSAYLAGLIFLISPALGIFAPLLGGLIAERYGFTPLFFAGAAVLVLPGIHYGRQASERIDIGLRRAWSAGKGIRSLVFIQGFFHGVDWVCVPIITLVYITSAVSYGGFFSIIAVAGAAATLYFCRLSDVSGNRVDYLYPSIVMTAAATILSAYASDPVNWFIVRAVVGFFVAVANPFTTSLVLDKVRSTEDAMYLREIILNTGRAFGVAAILACHLLFSNIQYAFIPAGLLLLAYPLIVEYKRLYKGVKPEAWESDETMEFHD